MSGDMKKKSRKGLKIFIALFIITGVALVSVGFISAKNAENRRIEMEGIVYIDTIYENVFINNIDIGGLLKKEAIKKVYDELKEEMDSKTITVVDKNGSHQMYYEDFDVKFPISDAVMEAFDYAREGELESRYKEIIALKKDGHHIKIQHTFNEQLIDENLKSIANDVYISPVNATMKRENSQFVITRGTDGLELDYEATGKQILDLLNDYDEGVADVATKAVEHQYTEEDMKEGQQLIGTGKTYYNGRGSGRVTNMDVSAEKINNYVLYPGEVFSTNLAFGDMTIENGYKNAPVIQNGELVEGMGGGVCQISSTLYNAILYSELEVVERRNHSLKVGYSDWGFDATLAGDYIDLKFRNDTDYPVFIESYLSANEVISNIYGKEVHSPSRKLEFKNALVSTNSPSGENVTYSSSLPSGSRHVKVGALTGYVYDLFKYVYEDGVLLEKIKVNRSTYKPRQAQVIMGTGSAPASGISNDEPEAISETTEVIPTQEEEPTVNNPTVD